MVAMSIPDARAPILAFGLAMALAGCSAGGPAAQPFAYGADAYMVEGRPGIIETHLRDPLPLSQATLIDDRGQSFDAIEITRDRVLYQGAATPAPGFGFGIMGGSSGDISTGFGLGIPLFGGAAGQTVAVNESFARFKIPDTERYNSSWQRWTIHLVLDDRNTSRVIEMLPPAPPDEGL